MGAAKLYGNTDHGIRTNAEEQIEIQRKLPNCLQLIWAVPETAAQSQGYANEFERGFQTSNDIPY